MTYKPKWAGYYIVSIFILSLDLFVHVTIIKIYNTIQYNFNLRGGGGGGGTGNVSVGARRA